VKRVKSRPITKVNFTIPKDRKNLLKWFPKSGKALGRIAKCPKCGLRGQLSFMFAYDSCIDSKGYVRRTMKAYLRNIDSCRFVISHYTTYKVNGIHKYIGCCHFNPEVWFDKLDSLLLHGRRIPATITRVYMLDVYGRGFDNRGKLLWKET
jgi:hypothetical protein